MRKVATLLTLRSTKIREMKDENNGNQTMLRLVPAQTYQRGGHAGVRRHGALGEEGLQVPTVAAERGTENVAGGHK